MLLKLKRSQKFIATGKRGVELRWETLSEQDLVGFNVLRSREDGGVAVAVNPVWIPALGDRMNSTAYHYLDATAEPGIAYVYRIQGITKHGLTRRTEAVVVRRRLQLGLPNPGPVGANVHPGPALAWNGGPLVLVGIPPAADDSGIPIHVHRAARDTPVSGSVRGQLRLLHRRRATRRSGGRGEEGAGQRGG